MKKPFGLACLLALALGSAAVAKPPIFDWPADISWTALFEGIDEAALTLTSPRPLRVHVLRLDLTQPGVRLLTDDDNGPLPEETNGLKTSTFLQRKGCQAAINGAPFWPGQKQEDQPQNVVGLVVSNGKLVSPVDGSPKARAALVSRRDGTLAIEQPPILLEGIETAVGGYGVVLEAGRVTPPGEESADIVEGHHPRSAVAVADGGRTLLMVVVDGRQPGYSEGVDLAELGELLRLLGAEDGLNLDGGGTSTLAVADPETGFRLMNRPINGKVLNQERISASHLGVRAKPLAQPVHSAN